MKFLLDNIQKLSLWMFCLLFPGQFLYSSAVGLGVIPDFLGSGVGVFTILAFILLFPFVVYTSSKLRRVAKIYYVLFIGLFLYTSSYLAFHYFFGSSLHQRPEIIEQWVVLIISWGAFFSIGYFWPEQFSKTDLFVLIILLLLMSVIVFINLEPDKFVYAIGRFESNEYLRYQGYARLMSVMGLVLLALIRHKYIFWLLCALFLIAIFLLGARSELACVFFVFPILIFYQWLENPTTTTVLVTLIAVMTLSIFIAMYWDEPSMSRQMKLLSPFDDKSVQHRKELNKQALEAIAKNPIRGDFSGHAIPGYGGIGYYAHNIISSWRQLGVVGFIFYSVLMLWPVIGTFCLFVKKPVLLQVDIWRVLGVVSVFMLLLALGAKSIFTSVFALSWGMFIAALKQTEFVNQKIVG